MSCACFIYLFIFGVSGKGEATLCDTKKTKMLAAALDELAEAGGIFPESSTGSI